MAQRRDSSVGDYEVLQQIDGRGATIRVFRAVRGAEALDRHLHRHSTQYYVALEGRIVIEHGDERATLQPYEAVTVEPGTTHRSYPVDEAAVVLTIYMPPVRAEDHIPVPVAGQQLEGE